MNLETLKSWYYLYNTESIYVSTHNVFLENFRINNEWNKDLFLKPKSTIYGIEFNNNNLFGFNSINAFTLLSIIDLHINATFNKSNKQVLIATNSDDLLNLKDFVIRFCNTKKIDVFLHNIKSVNEFLVLETLKSSQLKNCFYIYFNNANNKFYLKIFNNGKILSQEKQQEYINKLLFYEGSLILTKNNNSLILNIDKILHFTIENNITTKVEYFERIYKKPPFSISFISLNHESEYILNSLFSSTKFKINRLRNIYFHNLWNESNLSYTFLSKFTINNYKSDLLILINEKNLFKIWIKTKRSYRLLNEDELFYLFLNYNFISWKKKNWINRYLINIPFYASEYIKKMLYTYNIYFKESQEVNDNILISYTNNTFSWNNSQTLNYDNFIFLIDFCFMIYSYKINNNLYELKLKKLDDLKNEFLFKEKRISISYEKAKEARNYFNTHEKFSKNTQITDINLPENNSSNTDTFIKLWIRDKQTNCIVYMFYDFQNKNLVIKSQYILPKKKNIFYYKVRHFFLIKKIISALNSLLK
ncbi:MAG5620 family putative phospho-sugar mutase [Mycoplasma leonicaptivi]|uniref:MAG5620 family putative phospho-sugar mutase n=1 Tax=Mycoplasma leonicaptivi TaxID=36742 RepID=UPI00047F578F|nr:hypothetical protein [Mycoplasma leonicaptivi]